MIAEYSSAVLQQSQDAARGRKERRIRIGEA
jgi:hypothetical protein